MTKVLTVSGRRESLPPYNEDRDGEVVPAAVADLRARIAAADAVLISTPEYNGTAPGHASPRSISRATAPGVSSMPTATSQTRRRSIAWSRSSPPFSTNTDR